MAIINLTNLFGITTANSAAQSKSVSFNGSRNVFAFKFDGDNYKDGFSTNPLYEIFKSKTEIEKLAKSSPRIMALLKEHNLPLRVNMDILEDMR